MQEVRRGYSEATKVQLPQKGEDGLVWLRREPSYGQRRDSHGGERSAALRNTKVNVSGAW